MLDELTARNLGLIDRAEVSLADGLTVITGETGTGKTLMLGALRLLRGDTARKGYIGPFGDDCEVGARFTLDAAEVVARRTIGADRSRAYIDDVAASAKGLADLVGAQVVIVGQHDQMTLTTSKGMRSLIDGSSGPGPEHTAYQAAWDTYRSVLAERDALGDDPKSLERQRDTARFQTEEISAAGLSVGEDAELADALGAARNADVIAEDVQRVLEVLGDEGSALQVDTAIAALRRVVDLDARFDGSRERLEALATELAEIAGDVAVLSSEVDADPEVLGTLEDRQATIGALKRKYGDSIAEVLAFGDEAAQRDLTLSEMLVATEDIEARVDAARTAVEEAGFDLRKARQSAADAMAAAAQEHLKGLGFTDPLVAISVEEVEPSATGADRPVLMFASDASLTPGPASGIASGGELSRLVLALTLAAGTEDAAVVAFDEVDAGVGGATALAMGEKLSSLAADRQVICVTHLPQVAAFADRHFAVERDGAKAHIRQLDSDTRVVELSRMLAGLSDSEKGQEHATELLALAGRTP